VTTGVRRSQPSRRSDELQLDGLFVARWLRMAAHEIGAHRDYLTQLDAAIGDADHGVNMDRGFRAVIAVLETADGLPPGELMLQAGATLMFRVGGAAGPLYGSALREAGRALGERPTFDAVAFVESMECALEGIVSLGAAVEGDKTMVDAWIPALAALRAGLPEGLGAAAHAARRAADDGASSTTPMRAQKGRASYLGPRSIGHQDPGAASSAILFAALERALD
jgi:dihydroxyacetone kinase-like protein